MACAQICSSNSTNGTRRGTRLLCAKDVARGLSENAQLSLDAAIAGVNATTFSAKEGVASLLARTMSGADKRALCAAANVDV